MLATARLTKPLSSAQRAKSVGAQVRCASFPVLTGVLVALLLACGALPTGAAETSSGDEIYLLSTRSVGVHCEPQRLDEQLECWRLMPTAADCLQWVPVNWKSLRDGSSDDRLTVVYVHGNRVEVGEDRAQGLHVYKSLTSARKQDIPVRFIIWSWPSGRVPGVIRDYQVKAERTVPVAWQLAWFLDQLPPETPLSLVGYSYGARIVGGTLHLLGGGQLESLQLKHRVHPNRAPARVALVAAAFDADWIHPSQSFGNALAQIDQMVVVTNRKDPAMRFYPLSTDGRRVPALGKEGILRLEELGPFRDRIQHVDVTNAVGRSHVLTDYLTRERPMSRVWEQLSAGVVRNPSVNPAYADLDLRMGGG